MGTYRIGILGSFSGKVGTVIGSSWNGIHYMRSLPRPSSKAPTEAQMLVRARFALASGFVTPIRSLFNATYKSAVGQTGVNAATAQIISQGITGTSLPVTLNYSQILISKGNLTGPSNGAAIAGTGSVAVSWENNSNSGNAKATDLAVTLVYNPVKLQYIYNLAGDARSTGTQNIALPTNFGGDTVQVWLAFISADGKAVSTSVFAGAPVVL